MEFSHRWVDQVLKQRGIPSPGLERIQAFLAASDRDTRELLFRALLRVERGTESPTEWDSVLHAMRGAKVLEPVASERVQPAAEAQERVGPLVANEHERMQSRACTLDKAGRPKHRIYGLRAALTVEMDDLRTKDEGGETLPTVILEAAQALGNRTYDWTNKIAFQFMRRELPLLACSLLGLLDKPLELGNHGQEANKFFVITDQGERLFVQVRQGSRLLAVPVGAADVHAWLNLVMLALARHSPAMGDAMQLAALQRVASMENARMAKKREAQ